LRSFIIGFDGLTLPDEVALLLSHGLAGVALFGRNIADADQVRALNGAIREAAKGRTPIIAVDQEGGRVQRLRHIVANVPTMAEIGQIGPDAARDIGHRIGESLADLGFNVDFAPVLDVASNPDNPIIGDRAFGDDPVWVAACGKSFVKGLESTGVLACGKHFPGHGDASADSHLELPVIRAELDEINVRELPPFEALVRAGIGMMMTAHCLYPAIDPEHPATLSRNVVTGLLRDRFGFDGVVITDDLGMKAVSTRYEPSDILRLGMAAGVDLFMHCGAAGEGISMIKEMTRLLEAGEVDTTRLSASQERISSFCLRVRCPL